MFRTLLALSLSATLYAQPDPNGGMTVSEDRPISEFGRKADIDWWREARFGLFIHWGVYAVPANGEWNMNREKTPVAEYRKNASRFLASKYDPDAWVRMAKQAGMKYIVITAKHHDGFALFDTKASDWNVVQATPYGKDLLKPLAEACRKHGLKLGFYYSQAQDWVNGGSAIGGKWDPAQERDMDSYVDKVAIPQVRELPTQYGKDVPAIIWWDTPSQFTQQHSKRMLAMVDSLRPDVLQNDRLGSYAGNYRTPEQIVPLAGLKGDWETCMTIGRAWGYSSWDKELKSSTTLIRKLADIASRGGNFLLNVGPTAEGEIPSGFVERLQEVGDWLAENKDSIYGTKAGPFRRLSWGCATRKGDRLYLHVFEWPADGLLRVPLLSDAKSACLLTDPEKPLELTKEKERLLIQLPPSSPNPQDSVVILDLAEEPVAMPLPTDNATASASASKPDRAAANVLDGLCGRRWEAPADVKQATLEIDLGDKLTITGFGFDEPDVWPRMKQSFVLEARVGVAWEKVAEGKTDGHGSVGTFPPLAARKFRMIMDCGNGGPAVAELQLYRSE